MTPLSAGELREAITGPAAVVGLKFEEGVIDALVHDLLGRRDVAAGAVDRSAEVVDDHLRTVAGEAERVLAADAAAGAGDDGHPTFAES